MFDAAHMEACLRQDIRQRLAGARDAKAVIDLSAMAASLRERHPEMAGGEVFELVFELAIETGVNCHWGLK